MHCGSQRCHCSAVLPNASAAHSCSLPCQRFAQRRHAFACLCYAVPLLSSALPCLRGSWLSFAPLLCVTMLCLCASVLFSAWPLQSASMQFFAFAGLRFATATLCSAIGSHCHSVPLLRIALLCLCWALPWSAVALLCITVPLLCLSLHIDAVPLQCLALLSHAIGRRCHSVPLPGSEPRCRCWGSGGACVRRCSTRVSSASGKAFPALWCRLLDSNQHPRDYKSRALPRIELSLHVALRWPGL